MVKLNYIWLEISNQTKRFRSGTSPYMELVFLISFHIRVHPFAYPDGKHNLPAVGSRTNSVPRNCKWYSLMLY